METLLGLVLKGGFRTSEFWVTVLGLVVTAVAPFEQGWVDALHAQQHSATSPVTSIALGAAAAVIAGTYTLARMLTKGKAAAAIATANTPTVVTAPPAPGAPPANATAVLLPTGNVMTPGPGSSSLEEAHRAAVAAATEALTRATEALTQASSLPRPATFGTPAPASSSSASAAAAPAASN